MNDLDKRPNPDILLEKLKTSQNNKFGKLKIFFGYAAGVGKTYAMLDDAHEQKKSGVNVLVGYVEPHTRPETLQLLEGLTVLPPKTVFYRNIELKEFDLDEVLRQKPDLVLVDELAHSNAVGVRNRKRYQDVEELLAAGIDVYTTVNVQHIESLNNVVEDITKINVSETVPDYIFTNAESVKIIDIDPDELLLRFKQGKIYRPERAKIAMNNFFTKENLRLLREIAMRKVTDRISSENQSERHLSVRAANIKLLVCVDTSTSSAKCIRWTARAAEAFHAHWTAIYVETIDGGDLSDQEQKTVRENLDLAVKLGAEIITLAGHDVAGIIAEYAELSGITNITIGKSKDKSRIKRLFENDFEDKLIALLPNIEIHIIPDNKSVSLSKTMRRNNWLQDFSFSWRDTIITAVIIIAVILLSIGLHLLNIGDPNIIMVYILSILIISRFTSGYTYGIIATFIEVLAFNFFFTEPYLTFEAIGAGYPITFIIMLIVALITSALTVRIKTQAKAAVEKEHRTDVLYEMSKKLLVTRGLENIIALASTYIANLFGRTVVFYSTDPEHGADGIITPTENDASPFSMNTGDGKAVAHWVFINQKRAGAGTDTLMGAEGFYMPIISQGKTLAVIGISCKSGNLDHDSRLFLRMIASQVAMALERQRLSDEQRNIMLASEKEKIRSDLLRAISHDLRTPLTGIFGASSTILETGESLDKKTHDQLITNIKDDSQWLIRMVENLLSVTRINEGTMNVFKTPEAAEEIIAEAVSRIRNRFTSRKISVHVPENLLIVPMDGTLIAQVLINLIENAIKHSPDDSTIEVTLKKDGENALFEIIDHGTGISKEYFPYLFESYEPTDNKSADSSRGMGIGLSICKSIIKAHNGKIEAENAKNDGAIFRFTLPLEGNS